MHRCQAYLEAIEGSPCSLVVNLVNKECPYSGTIWHVRKLGCLCGHAFGKSNSKMYKIANAAYVPPFVMYHLLFVLFLFCFCFVFVFVVALGIGLSLGQH